MPDMSRQATDVRNYMTGLQAYTTPRGFRVISLDYFADEDHTEEWANKERKLYTARDWRREYERDWSTPSGEPYYPEFVEIGRSRFIKRVDRLIKGPVFRSYDFGGRRPACTWFQYSPKADRLWLYREFMPHNLQAHQFRDAVRYLSGELAYEQLPECSGNQEGCARSWVDVYANKLSGAHCAPPWFPPGTRFVDISGKEALQGSAAAPTHEEGVTLNIFREGGIYLNMWNGLVAGRHQMLRRLLRIYPDGEPGLWIDPQAEEVIELMDGGLAYPKSSEAVPIPVKPRDDGHYINLADAFTYGVAAVIPEDRPKAPKIPKLVGYDEDSRETDIRAQPDAEDQIAFYETRSRG